MADKMIKIIRSNHDSVSEFAIREVVRIAVEHNGIGEVALHFGHDGDRTCALKDMDGDVLIDYSCNDMDKSVRQCVEMLKAGL